MLKQSYLKLIKIIDSIESVDQCLATRKFIDNFYKVHGKNCEPLIETYFEYKLEKLKINKR